MKWREMKGNVELLDMCMCIVFAFQLIRAKEVRIDIEVKRSEEKWREVMTCDVSPVAMFEECAIKMGVPSQAAETLKILVDKVQITCLKENVERTIIIIILYL